MIRTVSDVMTRTVVVVPRSASVKQLVGAMREHRVSALPVVDGGGSIVGVVSEGDLLLREDPCPGVQLVDGVQIPAVAPGLGVSVPFAVDAG